MNVTRAAQVDTARPQARQFRLLREVDGELLVLDDEHHVAHRLNHEAASVWRACDGTSDLASIAAQSGLPARRVEQLLGQLDALALLEPRRQSSLETRRVVLRRAVVLGVGIGVGLPAISSVLVPTAAEAFDSPQQAVSPEAGSGQGGSAEGQPAAGRPGGAVLAERRSGGTPQPRDRPSRRRAGGRERASRSPSVRNRVPAGATRTRRADTGELPFTGFNAVREVILGLAALASGVALRRHSRETD